MNDMVRFETIRTTIIRHASAIILALFFGAVFVYPQMIAKFYYGIPFDSPSNNRIDDETFYFGRIRDVIDGYPTIGNAYLWEHKSKPPSPVFLGEYLVAQPIRLLGMGVVAGGVLYDALLPPILAILTYICLFRITHLRWLSILGSVYLLFGVSLSDFARIVSPQFNFLLWLTQSLLLFSLLSRDHTKRDRMVLIALSALNFGVLFYLYTYYWTFFLAFLGIAFFLFLLSRERERALSIVIVILGGLILAIPYFRIAVRAFRLPEYGETLRRIGMIDSHFPSGIAIVVPGVLLFVLIVVLIRGGVITWNPTAIFFSSGVLAAIASVNQHVITGKNLEFSSHYFLLSMFWFVFTGAWLLRETLPKLAGLRPYFILLLATFVVVVALRGHTEFPAWRETPLKRIDQNQYIPILSWLKDHIERDEVVYAPTDFSALIPIYTSANVFYSNLVRLSFISDSEIIDRFILENYFRTIDRSLVLENLTYIFGVGYIDEALHTAQENRVRMFVGLTPREIVKVPPDLVERVLERSQELHQSSFEVELKKFRVDYIVWDVIAEPVAPFDRMSSLAYVGTVGDYRIYQNRGSGR